MMTLNGLGTCGRNAAWFGGKQLANCICKKGIGESMHAAAAAHFQSDGHLSQLSGNQLRMQLLD